mgnify:CR=1 FL=1
MARIEGDTVIAEHKTRARMRTPKPQGQRHPQHQGRQPRMKPDHVPAALTHLPERASQTMPKAQGVKRIAKALQFDMRRTRARDIVIAAQITVTQDRQICLCRQCLCQLIEMARHP